MRKRPYTIAVASGKGGTGKTSVATSLARVAAAKGHLVALVDGDVDAPNAALFLPLKVQSAHAVTTRIPEVNASVCTLCGQCAQVCRYKAMAVLGPSVVVFPELCHACGGCAAACPVNAITEVDQRVGEVRRRGGDQLRLIEGVLDIGQVKAPLVIDECRHEVAANDSDTDLCLIDAPPGTSCAVVACFRGADFLVLVTEPTPFGLHDLARAVDLARRLDLPCGVVLNREGSGDTDIPAYCSREHVPLLARVPFSREVAAAYAQGADLLAHAPEWAAAMEQLYDALCHEGLNKP